MSDPLILEWKEPRQRRTSSRVVTDEVLAALATRPGQFAVIRRVPLTSRKSTYVFVAHQNKRHPDFEFCCRTEGDDVVVYGRKRV